MATTSRMRRHAPFEQTDVKICMLGLVADCANFFENQSQDLGATVP